MQVPLNVLHNYIAFPTILLLAIDTFRRNRRDPNVTANLLAWGCLLSSIAALCFGFPALFTHDAQLLSIGTLIGEYAFAASMACIWLVVLRAAFSTRPRLLRIAMGLVALLTIAIAVEAIERNLAFPYSTFIVNSGDSIALTYRDTNLYTILNGIDCLAMLFIGIYFWKQAKLAATTAQRLRIRSLAAGLLCFAAAFVITPAFPIANQARISFSLLSLGVIIIGVFGLIGWYLSSQATETPAPPANPTT